MTEPDRLLRLPASDTVGRRTLTLNLRRFGIVGIAYGFCRPVSQRRLRRMRTVGQSRVWLAIQAHYFHPGKGTRYWSRMWKQERREW